MCDYIIEISLHFSSLEFLKIAECMYCKDVVGSTEKFKMCNSILLENSKAIYLNSLNLSHLYVPRFFHLET